MGRVKSELAWDAIEACRAAADGMSFADFAKATASTQMLTPEERASINSRHPSATPAQRELLAAAQEAAKFLEDVLSRPIAEALPYGPRFDVIARRLRAAVAEVTEAA